VSNKGKGGGRRGRQCAALPFSRQDGEVRVLLVTSRETHRWIIPKGWMEKRLAPHALAAKEAFEEAASWARWSGARSAATTTSSAAGATG